MKNTMKPVLVSLFLIVPWAFAQQQAAPVKLDKLSDSLYEILGGQGAIGGMCIGENAVLLVDTKMDKNSMDQILEEVKKQTDKPIRFLVNTHSDGDHVRGNRYMPETVTIIAQENCRKEFFVPGRDGRPSEWSNPDLLRFAPSITFRDNMEIYLGSKKAELYYFGIGHTTGDAVVYFPMEKIAFIGDLVFLTRPQLIHAYKGGNFHELIKTLTKMLATIDAQQFLSGHSEKTDRNGIKNYIEQLTVTEAKVRARMTTGKSLDEIKSEFKKEEAALVEVIYSEIKKASQ